MKSKDSKVIQNLDLAQLINRPQHPDIDNEVYSMGVLSNYNTLKYFEWIHKLSPEEFSKFSNDFLDELSEFAIKLNICEEDRYFRIHGDFLIGIRNTQITYQEIKKSMSLFKKVKNYEI